MSKGKRKGEKGMKEKIFLGREGGGEGGEWGEEPACSTYRLIYGR